MNNYTVPIQTRIGHVHLKVSNIEKSLKFYCELLWFELVSRFGEQAAFVSAGWYHHHIGLNTRESKDAPQSPRHTTWLYHVAILYPTRKDLAIIVQRLIDHKISIWSADHGVSEAIYLEDPDGNGIELYRDRPQELRPRGSDWNIEMYTEVLDIQDLLSQAIL
jgi:catechol 2,3-dioxygenase